MKEFKLGVFIPGRLSSERLPNKLILPLGESSLWEMACKKLSQLPEKYNAYALCADKELVDIAKKYDIEVIIRSEATTQAEGPLNYIFEDMKDVDCTHLMFLNPCLSFLTLDTIVKRLEEFERERMDYATSVKEFNNWLFDIKATPLNVIDYTRLTTKEVKGYFQMAHCFHVFNKKAFFKDGMMLKEGHGLLYIPEGEDIDVDTPEDYEFAKWKHTKSYVFDIDDTICINAHDDKLDYSLAIPITKNIEKINQLYNAGNTIKFQTARGFVTGKDWRAVTEKQLNEWGVKYHELYFDKPNADIYVDDKGVNAYDFFSN